MQSEKHIMQIQSLELRVQTQSRALESRHWDIDALKEAAAKMQGQLDINQSCLDVSQQQMMGYLQQLQACQQSLRSVFRNCVLLDCSRALTLNCSQTNWLTVSACNMKCDALQKLKFGSKPILL